MPRKAKKVTSEELMSTLREKVFKFMLSNDEVDNRVEFDEGYKDDFLSSSHTWLCEGDIAKDLSKIEFDFENTFFTSEDWPGPGVGVQAEGDFTFLGVYAGGDWEHPIYFILYVDNNDKIRGYIPTDGNVFNKKLKSAFGNNDGEDYKWNPDGTYQVIKTGYGDNDAAKDQYGLSSAEDLHKDDYFDWEKMKADILSRIVIER